MTPDLVHYMYLLRLVGMALKLFSFEIQMDITIIP